MITQQARESLEYRTKLLNEGSYNNVIHKVDITRYLCLVKVITFPIPLLLYPDDLLQIALCAHPTTVEACQTDVTSALQASRGAWCSSFSWLH